MIFIVVKWPVRPDRVEEWPSLVEDFTRSTRAEPGNLFFEWSRSLENPDEYVLVEAFQDDAAAAHVGSEHFTSFVDQAPDWVTATPRIISVQGVPGEGWSEMAEVQPR